MRRPAFKEPVIESLTLRDDGTIFHIDKVQLLQCERRLLLVRFASLGLYTNSMRPRIVKIFELFLS